MEHRLSLIMYVFLCFLMYHRQELIRFFEKLVDFFNIYAVSSDGTVRYSDVRAFLDKDETTIGLYISITTVVNNTIALTPNHLVYVNKNFNDQFVLLLVHGRLISEATSGLGVHPRVELEQEGQTSTEVELLTKKQRAGQRVSTSPSSIDSDLQTKRSRGRRFSLQPFRMKSCTSESMLKVDTETRSSPSRDTGLQPRRVSIDPSRDNASQPRRTSISPSRDLDRSRRVSSRRGGGRRLSLDFFGFTLDQSESGDPQVKVESMSTSRRPSLDLFKSQKHDSSEPQLYPGTQVKSQEEVRSNIYQLFYGDCARAVNKDTSRDQDQQYPDGNHSNCCPDVPDCDLNNSDSGDKLSSEHKGWPGDPSAPTAHAQTPLNCRNNVPTKHGSQTRENCLNSYSAVIPGNGIGPHTGPLGHRRISHGRYPGALGHSRIESGTKSGTLKNTGIGYGTHSGIPYYQEPTRRGSDRFGTRLYGYPGSPHGKNCVGYVCACMCACVTVHRLCLQFQFIGRTEGGQRTRPL